MEGFYWDPFIGEPLLPETESTGILVLEISYGGPIIGKPLLRPLYWRASIRTPADPCVGKFLWELILGKPLLGSLCWKIVMESSFLEGLYWNPCIGKFLQGALSWDASAETSLLESPLL